MRKTLTICIVILGILGTLFVLGQGRKPQQIQALAAQKSSSTVIASVTATKVSSAEDLGKQLVTHAMGTNAPVCVDYWTFTPVGANTVQRPSGCYNLSTRCGPDGELLKWEYCVGNSVN